MFINNKITCPFCGVTYSTFENDVFCLNIYTEYNDLFQNIRTQEINKSKYNKKSLNDLKNQFKNHSDDILLFMCVCPNCKKTYSFVEKLGTQYKGETSNESISPLIPLKRINKYRNFVPKNIFKDYVEAYKILHLSPQSSATLSRRILEEIIGNYFKITHGRLIDKINDTLHSMRQIGNIGAHMEKRSNEIIRLDNPEEAKVLLKMIEILFDHTYVSSKKNEDTEDEIKRIRDEYN